MILKVEDELKLLGRTDPVPKVGILGHIPLCLKQKIKKYFRCTTPSQSREVVY